MNSSVRLPYYASVAVSLSISHKISIQNDVFNFLLFSFHTKTRIDPKTLFIQRIFHLNFLINSFSSFFWAAAFTTKLCHVYLCEQVNELYRRKFERHTILNWFRRSCWFIHDKSVRNLLSGLKIVSTFLDICNSNLRRILFSVRGPCDDVFIDSMKNLQICLTRLKVVYSAQ